MYNEHTNQKITAEQEHVADMVIEHMEKKPRKACFIVVKAPPKKGYRKITWAHNQRKFSSKNESKSKLYLQKITSILKLFQNFLVASIEDFEWTATSIVLCKEVHCLTIMSAQTVASRIENVPIKFLFLLYALIVNLDDNVCKISETLPTVFPIALKITYHRVPIPKPTARTGRRKTWESIRT